MENITLTESLMEKLGVAENLDEVVRVCGEEGVEITKDQLEAAASRNEEFSEEELEDVTGGCYGVAILVAVTVYMYWRYLREKQRRESRR